MTDRDRQSAPAWCIMARVVGAAVLATSAGAQVAGAAAAVPTPPTDAVATAPAAVSETVFLMASRTTGRTYRIQVFKPLLPPPPAGYPVVFVTDGSGMFRTAADQMWAREFGDLKPSVIVGLSQPTNAITEFARLRMWDLTPDRPNAAFTPVFNQMSGLAPVTSEDTGGAEHFYRFITDELKPELAKRYRIDSHDEALFGHSLGGLFTLHVLFNHPDAFRTFVASSPTLMWNQGSVLQAEAAFSAAVATGTIRPRVLLLKGGLEPGPEVLALSARLAALKGPPGFEVAFHDFDGENHLSVTAAAVARALTFAVSKAPPAGSAPAAPVAVPATSADRP